MATKGCADEWLEVDESHIGVLFGLGRLRDKVWNFLSVLNYDNIEKLIQRILFFFLLSFSLEIVVFNNRGKFFNLSLETLTLLFFFMWLSFLQEKIECSVLEASSWRGVRFLFLKSL